MLKFKNMKACKTLFLLSLLLFCRAIWTQTVDSSITIKVTNESYIVSGVVRSEYVRNEVVEQIKARFGAKADFKRLTIQPDAQSFQTGWQAQLETVLLKIKDWRSGVFVFGNQVSPGNYPPLPETIASARFTLTDGQTVSLEDFSNKVAVLLLFATWNPAQPSWAFRQRLERGPRAGRPDDPATRRARLAPAGRAPWWLPAARHRCRRRPRREPPAASPRGRW